MGDSSQFPDLLYKAFSRREYAEAFCAGRIRFSSLQSYRDSQDAARADPSEGVGVVQQDADASGAEPPNARLRFGAGLERIRIEAPERECFICCFSLPDDDVLKLLPLRFGNFFVKVNSPARLYQDIQAAIRKETRLGPQPPELEAGAVRYDKGRYVGRLRDSDEIRALPWLQKPAYYAEENEYRLHFRCLDMKFVDIHKDHIIEIGRSLPYCEMFERNGQ